MDLFGTGAVGGFGEVELAGYNLEMFAEEFAAVFECLLKEGLQG